MFYDSILFRVKKTFREYSAYCLSANFYNEGK